MPQKISVKEAPDLRLGLSVVHRRRWAYCRKRGFLRRICPEGRQSGCPYLGSRQVPRSELSMKNGWLLLQNRSRTRGENGHGHGGQSWRERTTWISTNIPVNSHFTKGSLAITDIAPSICRYMGFEIPQAVLLGAGRHAVYRADRYL